MLYSLYIFASSFSYQAPVIGSQLPVSVCHSTSVSSFKSSSKTFLFLKTFSSVSLPWYATCVCVHMRVRVSVCVCVHSCCMHWILTIRICKECVSALGLSGLGALSIHSYSYWQVQAKGLVKKKGVGGVGAGAESKMEDLAKTLHNQPENQYTGTLGERPPWWFATTLVTGDHRG